MDKKKVTVYITEEINEKLRSLSYATKKPKGVLVDEIMERFFAQFEENAKKRGVYLSGK